MDRAYILARIAAIPNAVQAEPAMPAAQRMREKRQRDKAAGKPVPKRERAPQQYDPSRSLFKKGAFVAIDGEGVSEGDEQQHKVKGLDGAQVYTSRPHYMVLLAASAGRE